MPKGIRRCLSLALFVTLGGAGLFSAGCASTQQTTMSGSRDKKQKVLLAFSPCLFSTNIDAFPERLVIKGYKDEPSWQAVVTWTFVHSKTTITFDDKRIGDNGVVECNNGDGECRVILKGKLLDANEQSHIFKYKVTGEDDQGTRYSDPDVDVER